MSPLIPNGDARVLLLLCCVLPATRNETPAPLAIAEWQRVGRQLHQDGLSRPGELLGVGPGFWAASGLTEEDTARVQGLLSREAALDHELERLAGLGIRAITSSDTAYPARLRKRLRGQSPPVLFAAGEWALIERAGLAVVGSRGIDAAGAAFTRAVAARCARDGLVVVTGGAKGVDQVAMREALGCSGAVIGVLAGNLERAVRAEEVSQWLAEGTLLLLSPYHPKVGFTVGNAMARNKVIYALAEYGLVVSSACGQGGTWAGAREVQRHGWVPLFVRDDPAAPDGNRELLRPAARPFPPLESLGDTPLGAWLAEQSAAPSEGPAASDAMRAADDGLDLLPLIWPRLAAFLAAPRRPSEVAAAFRLKIGQAQAWLHRAEAEGRVVRVEGPVVRYRSVTHSPTR